MSSPVWKLETEAGFIGYAYSQNEATESFHWLHGNFPKLGDIKMTRLSSAEQEEYWRRYDD